MNQSNTDIKYYRCPGCGYNVSEDEFINRRNDDCGWCEQYRIAEFDTVYVSSGVEVKSLFDEQ